MKAHCVLQQPDASVVPCSVMFIIQLRWLLYPGHTYERAAILSWFEEQRRSKPVLTSPMTNAVLASDQVPAPAERTTLFCHAYVAFT